MRALALFSLLTACAPPLRLEAAAPNPIAPGGTLIVEGAGFGSDMRLSLVGAGADVTLQRVVVEDAGRAQAVVPAAAPTGSYDVVATLGDARATLPGLRVLKDAARVYFLDVGQGDATLVVAPTGETLLIDGGPSEAGAAVRGAIATLAGGRLDAVVLTHFHADHLGGLTAVLAGEDGVPGSGDDLLPARRWSYADDGQCDSFTCDRMRRLRAWPFDVVTVGDSFLLGDIEIEAVAADGDAGAGRASGVDDPNERSVAVRISFGGRSVLVLGDLTGGGAGEADVEGPLSQRTGAIDVLRTGHHGSNTSTSAGALARWQPRAAIISVGTDNDYCHPTADTLDRLQAAGARVYATGAGMVSGTSCARTVWPANAHPDVGTIALEIDLDGALTIAGDPL
jgi:beta-lactamase superfamily II metal-dependent hydrolase